MWVRVRGPFRAVIKLVTDDIDNEYYKYNVHYIVNVNKVI